MITNSLPLSLVPRLPLLLCRSEADCVDATTFPVASETKKKQKTAPWLYKVCDNTVRVYDIIMTSSPLYPTCSR